MFDTETEIYMCNPACRSLCDLNVMRIEEEEEEEDLEG